MLYYNDMYELTCCIYCRYVVMFKGVLRFVTGFVSYLFMVRPTCTEHFWSYSIIAHNSFFNLAIVIMSSAFLTCVKSL